MDRWRSPMLPFALGLVLAGAVGISLYAYAPASIGSLELPFFEDAPDEPVLVIVVGTASRVQLVHDAIDRSGLVAAQPRGFALAARGGIPRRIVAADYDAVGPILGDAQWIDAPIEIVTPPRRQDTPRGRREAQGAGHDGVDLESLAAKPTLTLAEAIALLNSGAL